MNTPRPIYFDYQSTTPVDPRVREAMLPALDEWFGNPSSAQHAHGWTAREAVAQARERVAILIHADPSEIVFTSCATESNNLALKGIAETFATKGDHLIVSAIEHPSVLETARHLSKRGTRVTIIGVDGLGRVDPDDIRAALTPRTVLVSIMHASNEIGTIQDIAAIGGICRDAGVLLHTDAAQSASKIDVDTRVMHADLLSLSAHKMYGPKGVGALFLRAMRPRLRLAPLLDGGGQEGGQRSGTANVPGIVGFGAAAAIAVEELAEAPRRIAQLRDALQQRFEATGGVVHGDPARRLPDNLSVRFEGIPAASLLRALRGFALSTGSACSSESGETSHVLAAIGLEKDAAASTLRFSLGRMTSRDDVETAARAVESAIRDLRAGLHGDA
jgi:cysteine desulfurase